MRVFVYGTLLSGEGNHRHMGGGRLLAVRRTEPRYTLVDLGAFPALLGGESVEGYVLARPRAERYEVIRSGDWREHRCASKS